jgi:hypothetical protein
MRHVAPPPPPAEIAWMVQAIGLDNALAVIERFGGTRVYLPVGSGEGSELAAIIGRQALSDLRQAREARAGAAGTESYLKVPLVKQWRAAVYRAERDSYARIALRLGCTERAVAKWLREAGLTERQGALFPE